MWTKQPIAPFPSWDGEDILFWSPKFSRNISLKNTNVQTFTPTILWDVHCTWMHRLLYFYLRLKHLFKHEENFEFFYYWWFTSKCLGGHRAPSLILYKSKLSEGICTFKKNTIVSNKNYFIGSLPPTAYVKMIDFWLIFAQSIPFFKVKFYLFWF